MKKSILFLLVIGCGYLIKPNLSNGQSLYKVSDKEKVNASSIVIEGVVTDQLSFWNDQHTFIYTSNTIHVYKVFKGVLVGSEVEIVTQGGEVDGYTVSASELLTLKQNEVGVFCCSPNSIKLKSPVTGNELLDVYADRQGFFKYDMGNYTAATPFNSFSSITQGLYQHLNSLVGNTYKLLDASFNAERKNTTKVGGTLFGTGAGPKIASFFPDTTIAGATLDPTHNTLTVKGSGFGTNTGLASLWFSATYFPGARYYVNNTDPLLISWSDTQIVAKVPSDAGTGKIWVENSTGVFDSTSKLLIIPYSLQTSTYRSGTGTGATVVTKQLNLMNTDDNGGYTFILCNASKGGGMNFDSAARGIFNRSLTTWKSATGFNATVSPAASALQTIAGDNINMVMFDNANTGLSPLPAGSLGVTYYYSTICTPVATNAYKKVGFDMVIRSKYSLGTTNFSFGPCPPIASPDSVYDIESTIFHELGHTIGLAHVNARQQGTKLPFINPAPVMSAGISDGVRRTSLDYDAIVGAKYLVKPKGNLYGGTCFGSPAAEMTPSYDSIITVSNDEIPNVFPSTSLPQGTVVKFDLVNATSNIYTDPQASGVNCSGNIMAITNNAYYAFKTNVYGGKLDLAVSGYTTSPTDLAACNASGIQLSLYQANSAPTAGNFPPPVACRTFNGDSALTGIGGLAPYTSYLLFLEGIDNTKANFSLTFGGEALPVKFQTFTGSALTGYNIIKWVISQDANLAKITLQKGLDGTHFNDYESYAGKVYSDYTVKDYSPNAQTSYYRLLVTNLDGTKSYSNIVAIRGTEKLSITVFPNPVRNTINLQFNALEDLGKVNVKLFDGLGREIAVKAAIIEQGVSVAQLPAINLAKGYYHLVVLDKDSHIIKKINVEKQ